MPEEIDHGCAWPKEQWEKIDKMHVRIKELAHEIEENKSALGNAFVDGAKWWEFTKTGGTMWQSDQQKAADEAIKRKMPFRPVMETRLEAELEKWKRPDDDERLKEVRDHYENGKSLASAQAYINGLIHRNAHLRLHKMPDEVRELINAIPCSHCKGKECTATLKDEITVDQELKCLYLRMRDQMVKVVDYYKE